MRRIIHLLSLTFTVFVLSSCSIHSSYKEENTEANPEYLEETQLAVQTTQQMIEELQRLQDVKTPEYKIGPGDKFKVFVYDEPELDTDVAIVKQDGTMSFRLIGEVKVEGLTVAEATAEIEKRLQKFLTYPKVSMMPFEVKSSTVTILGKVTYPQIYTIDGHMRLLDALAKAGGLALGYFQANSVELADLERSMIIRNGEILPVDFVELINKGNMLHNIPLMDKDYIYLPSAINKEIYVIGEVNQPGHFFFKESMTLLQGVAFAQGMKESAQSNVYVIRGNLSHPRLFKINTKAILKAKVRDFALKPNDILYVPKSPIADWNNVISQALPSLQVIQGGYLTDQILNNKK